jgi:hypothetical protein
MQQHETLAETLKNEVPSIARVPAPERMMKSIELPSRLGSAEEPRQT